MNETAPTISGGAVTFGPYQAWTQSVFVSNMSYYWALKWASEVITIDFRTPGGSIENPKGAVNPQNTH